VLRYGLGIGAIKIPGEPPCVSITRCDGLSHEGA
jgi:hypothetical protein